jgi:hypothetical protein
MLRRIFWFGCASGLLAIPALTQDANSGLSLPVTLSGGGLYSGRLQLRDPAESPFTGGIRAMLDPTLKLGEHWFGYAAIQVTLAPYFYYDAYSPNHEWLTNVIQAFAGYSWRDEKISMVVKAGRLSSAFGSFPLRYDDAVNPLLDQPLSYIQSLTLRPDQVPCGVSDLLSQPYGSVSHLCGGVPGRQRGLTPVTLYGLPAIEADVSSGRLDGRLQITDGSPANPQGLDHVAQYIQWTAGAGYTIRQGFRIGIAGFRGPYLDRSLTSLLPAGTSLRDFPADAVGVDAQWERGRWSVGGEWQRFRFESPNFVVSPSIASTYAEVKTVLTPRLFVAGRAGWLSPGGAVDKRGISTGKFAPSIASYELGTGLWLNHRQLLKASYEWFDIEHQPGTRFNVLGIQLVTTFHTLDWPFR